MEFADLQIMQGIYVFCLTLELQGELPCRFKAVNE